MKFFCIIIFILITSSSCHRNNNINNDQELIIIDPDKAKTVDLNDAIDIKDISRLVYPDSIGFGNVTSIKKYGEYLLIGSEYNSMSILCFKNNEYQYHLERIGGGPGEYGSLHSFAANPITDELIIYDRSQLKLLHYSLTDGSFKKDYRFDKFLSNIDYLGNNSLIYSTDFGSDENTGYLNITSLDFSMSRAKLGTATPLIAEAVFPFQFTFNGNELFYMEPFSEVVYSISETSISPRYKFSFGDKAFPKQFWKSTDIEAIEDKLRSSDYAFSGHLFNQFNGVISFFYYNTPEYIQLAKINLNSGDIDQIKNISEELTDGYIPWPKACYNNEYLYLIPEDEISVPQQSFWDEKLNQHLPQLKTNSANSIVLLSFGLK